MSFIVETGAGIAGANSYVSLVDANAYHADRITAATWAALTDALKQAYLIHATEYIEGAFEWASGVKNDEDNGLSWPRYGAYDRENYMLDSDIVPEQLKHAVCELAVKVTASAPLQDDVDRETKSESVGPISVTYLDRARDSKFYKFATNMLKGLILGDNTSMVLRA